MSYDRSSNLIVFSAKEWWDNGGWLTSPLTFFVFAVCWDKSSLKIVSLSMLFYDIGRNFFFLQLKAVFSYQTQSKQCLAWGLNPGDSEKATQKRYHRWWHKTPSCYLPSILFIEYWVKFWNAIIIAFMRIFNIE